MLRAREPWFAMKTAHSFNGLPSFAALATAAFVAAGCASSGPKNETPRQASEFKATDGRTIEIGRATPAEGGRTFKNPHLDKCWVAGGFTFNGYDTLFIAPISVTAEVKDDERERLQLATQQIPAKLTQFLTPKGMFTNIVTRDSDIKPGARTLRFENTITDYSKGSRAARVYSLYGAGQPMLRVEGRLLEGDKPLFTYEARRSGTSAGSRVGGLFMSGDNIQDEDVHSMMLDLTDFMAAIAGKYPPKN